MLPPEEYVEYLNGVLGKYSRIIKEIQTKKNDPFIEIRNEVSIVINGRIIFTDNSFLDVREYIVFENEKLFIKKYAFQYQKDEIKKVFRYDNIPHWKTIESFPEHKHLFIDVQEEPGEVESCYNITINKVLKEITNNYMKI